jgi:hypothetical protein
VSRTPVREAIQRLVREGWVQVWPQRGSVVALLSLQRIRDAPIYALRRPDGSDLHISRLLLSCLYDLNVSQLCSVMRISLTTAKKIRGWAGLRCWPRVDMLAGRCPGLDLGVIYSTRLQMMGWVRENNDMGAHEVLVRAQLANYPDSFDPIPSYLLDRLDDMDLDAACPPCDGAPLFGPL